jgi:DNA-binding NarL/FixJ family response regulator
MADMSVASARALVVDDHPIVTDALSAALISLRIFKVIDKEASLAGAVARLRTNADYGLVLLDVHLDDTIGLELMREMRERYPDVPVVVFSGDELVSTITTAFEHGVQGYIPKSSPMPVVVNAIRVVLAGGVYVPPQMAHSLHIEHRDPVKGSGAGDSLFPDLSPRQQQVLHYLLQGLPNKVIAARLDMADGTVKSHLSTIYRVFSVNSRAQLILRAQRLGLV